MTLAFIACRAQMRLIWRVPEWAVPHHGPGIGSSGEGTVSGEKKAACCGSWPQGVPREVRSSRPCNGSAWIPESAVGEEAVGSGLELVDRRGMSLMRKQSSPVIR
jgi:hypothetical protein